MSPNSGPADPEVPVVFANGTRVGVLHRARTTTCEGLGVLVVVGGPNYRIGSHRQFVELGRALADMGIAVFRFDSGGMGDSEGALRSFEVIGPDIELAMTAFFSAEPQLSSLVLWGLCDGATAALLHAATSQDQRVAGLVMLNPWARTEQGEAAAMVRHYYLKQFFSPVFWRKFLQGEVAVAGALVGLWEKVRLSLATDTRPPSNNADLDLASQGHGLPVRMLAAFARCDVPVLVVLSPDDLTAQEFDREVLQRNDRSETTGIEQMTVFRVAGADHTFSAPACAREVERLTAEFCQQVYSAEGGRLQ